MEITGPKGPLPEKLVFNPGKLRYPMQFLLHTEHRPEAGGSVLRTSIQWHFGGQERAFSPPCYEIREVLGQSLQESGGCPCGTAAPPSTGALSPLLRHGMFARTVVNPFEAARFQRWYTRLTLR